MKCRPIHLALFSWFLMSASVRADEKLPVLKVGSETYSNVTVTSVSSTDIYFKFDKGVANAKLKKLEPALQERFREQADKAKIREQNEKESAALFRERISREPAPPPPVGEERPRYALKGEIDTALARVKQIVNQPVKPVEIDKHARYLVKRVPAWYPLKNPPVDSMYIDVHLGLVVKYDRDGFIGLSTEPEVIYPAREIEFNFLLQPFYEDRSVPKKRLTEEEMIEINDLLYLVSRDMDLLSGTTNRNPAPPKPCHSLARHGDIRITLPSR